VKAWSVKEEDIDAKKKLGAAIAEYDNALARVQGDRRQVVGAFAFDRHEATGGAHKRDVREVSLSGYETNPFFHNLGGGRFVNLTAPLGTALTDDGRAAVAMDFDRDGDEDLVVHNVFRPQLVALRNDLGRGRTVVVSLRGTTSNRFGVGARVVATVADRRTAQELACGSGYLSSQPPELVFGLGDADAIDTLEITWPSGGKQSLERLAPGRVTVEEGRGARHAPHETPAPIGLTPPERVARDGDVVAGVPCDTLDGAPADWSAMRGKPLVAMFWSGYCKSCEIELGQTRDIVAELKRVDPRAEFVSVNVDGERERLREVHERKPFAVPPLVLRGRPQGFLPSSDPVVPLVLVLDGKGVVRARHVGAQTPQEFAALLRRAMR
jgi:thiol-disulfide isomerase/thioredoxin